MKQIKTTIVLLLLILISAPTSAEIKLRTLSSTEKQQYKNRTYIPRFDIDATKHNTRIENTTPNRNYHSTSYITTETQHTRTNNHYQILSGSSKNSYYQQYTPTNTASQNVTYQRHTTMKAYNPANNQPFSDESNAIITGPTQHAFGPPTEGPINDIIFPLLTLAGIYILKLKIKER